MNRALFASSAPLGELLLHTATVIFLGAAATAYAATDGLAISGSPPAATMGHAYSFTPTVSNPAKRALHFNIVSKPAWVTFNSSTGHLAGTPTAANVWRYPVAIGVTDGIKTVFLHFYITVFPPAADKPVLSGTPPTRATVGQTYSFRPTVRNPAKLGLHFNVWNKPAWASFNYSTGQLEGTPPAASAGTVSGVTILVTDGVDKAYLPVFYLHVYAATGTADKPVISGTPPTTIAPGSAYRFQPTAKDPDGRALSFSVRNKPAWASFSISTGLLDGTPTKSQDGTYGNIIISASNGRYSSALPAFSVTVKSGTSGTPGAATIDWAPPTANTNGTRLTDLAGIRIYYGTSASNLSHMAEVAVGAGTRATISNLTAGTWYFAGVAYTTKGTESAMSRVVSKYIP